MAVVSVNTEDVKLSVPLDPVTRIVLSPVPVTSLADAVPLDTVPVISVVEMIVLVPVI